MFPLQEKYYKIHRATYKFLDYADIKLDCPEIVESNNIFDVLDNAYLIDNWIRENINLENHDLSHLYGEIYDKASSYYKDLQHFMSFNIEDEMNKNVLNMNLKKFDLISQLGEIKKRSFFSLLFYLIASYHAENNFNITKIICQIMDFEKPLLNKYHILQKLGKYFISHRTSQKPKNAILDMNYCNKTVMYYPEKLLNNAGSKNSGISPKLVKSLEIITQKSISYTPSTIPLGDLHSVYRTLDYNLFDLINFSLLTDRNLVYSYYLSLKLPTALKHIELSKREYKKKKHLGKLTLVQKKSMLDRKFNGVLPQHEINLLCISNVSFDQKILFYYSLF